MKLKFIKSSEKKRIISALKEQFGLSNLPFLLIRTGKERIRGFTGHLSKEEIAHLSNLINIETLGLYILKEEHEFRLSIDATHLLSNQLTENIIQIDNSQFQDWIRGHNLNIATTKGAKIIQYENDFIGSGISNGQKIFNYIPKDRRLRK